jgi:hypothetical protein
MHIHDFKSNYNPDWARLGQAESAFIFGKNADKSTPNKKSNRLKNIDLLKNYFQNNATALLVLKECEKLFV